MAAYHILVNPDNGIDFPYSDELKANRRDLVERWIDEGGNEIPPPKESEPSPVVVPTVADTVTSVNIEFVPGADGKVCGEVNVPGAEVVKEEYTVTIENVTQDDYDKAKDDVAKLEKLAADIGVDYSDIKEQFEAKDFEKYLKKDLKKKINQAVFQRMRREEAKNALAATRKGK